jgi:protein-disulfide isomerase
VIEVQYKMQDSSPAKHIRGPAEVMVTVFKENMSNFVLAGLLFGAVALAQSASPPNQATMNQDSVPAKAAPSKTARSSRPAEPETAKSKSVKAESVTINMPESITRDQADAILNELKQIHQLLANQQTAAAAAKPAAVQAVAPSDKVKMSVGQGWYAMGREDAPVTMVEFTDYQCPFCRKFEHDSFAELKKDYIDTGKVRFVSRDLPLEFHPNAAPAAEAVRCAGEQHKFWELHDAIMQDTGTDLSADSILKYGDKVGLDATAFRACVAEKRFGAAIQKDTTDAGTVGISGTPSFVIAKTAPDQLDGVRIVGAVPYAVFDSAIKDALTK